MLLVGLREGVTSGAVSYEIKLARAGGIGGGFERGAAGIGDRARRQSVDLVGIVRRRLIDLALHDRPAQRAFAADQSVDDGRVGLQLHLLLQPIDEHGGNARALFGLAGLPLDQRGENNELIRRLQRQIGRVVVPDVLKQVLLCLLHALDDLLAGDAAGEIVRVGEQAPFARDFLDVPGQDVVVQEARDDLLGGQAFRDGELMRHHPALDDGRHHVAQAGVRLELIFAGLEILARLEQEHAADEHP